MLLLTLLTVMNNLHDGEKTNAIEGIATSRCSPRSSALVMLGLI